MTSVQLKLHALSQAIKAIDVEKFENNISTNSISLISQHLFRPNPSSRANRRSCTPGRGYQKPLGLQSKVSPTKSKSEQEKFMKLLKQFYVCRCRDMELQQNESRFDGFRKIFLRKNKGMFGTKRLDLSGLCLLQFSLKLANSILADFQFIDISRNKVCIDQISNISKAKGLKELRIENCGLINEDLETLFQYLIATPIEKISISSPDLKDRNNLTKYEKLNQLISSSKTLISLEMQNVQISPDCPIFLTSARTTLEVLDLSKNTGVIGINKSLKSLNLSWNGLKKPFALKMMECSLVHLNLTGNPIPSYLFEQVLTSINYPSLEVLILNQIPFNTEESWLQAFLEKTKSLRELQMVNCEISKSCFLKISYGLETNHSLKLLNLSNNKVPKSVVESLAFGIHKSQVSKLWLVGCDLKDEYGVELFKEMKSNTNIVFMDLSKNCLGPQTSVKICQALKKSCYNILELKAEQNFIKYDQMKQIDDYIGRNVHLNKLKIYEEFNRLNGTLANEKQIKRRAQDLQKMGQQLRQETEQLSDQVRATEKKSRQEELSMIEEELSMLQRSEQVIFSKTVQVNKELGALEGMKAVGKGEEE